MLVDRVEYRKEYYLKNKERIRQRGIDYRAKNKDKNKLRCDLWTKKNPDKVKAAQKRYRSSDKAKAYRKKYRAENRCLILVTQQAYNEKHKEKQKMWFREYQINNRQKITNKDKRYLKQKYAYEKNRYDNDPIFKLTRMLRRRLRNAIHAKDLKKAKSSLELVGCSITELKVYLEKQFVSGMTWSNHGEWHIDHIHPCASYDLSNLEQLKECFHYSNLQPLWKIDNLRKSKQIGGISCAA